MFDKEKDKIIKALRAKHKINKFFMSVQNNLWIAGVVVCIALVFYILGDRLALNALTTVGFCLMGVDLVYLFSSAEFRAVPVTLPPVRKWKISA